MAVLSHSDLEAAWVLAGGLVSAQDTAAAISQAESGGKTDAIANTVYPNKPNYTPVKPGNLPEYSIGLWQINIYSHKQYTEAAMLTVAGNAEAAVALSDAGLHFDPWSTYTTTDPKRTYTRFLTGTVSTTPQQGTTFTAAPGLDVPHAFSGWADLRNSVNKHLPTQLDRSRRTGLITLRTLGGRSKVGR